ncbi:type IV pilus modification PilV family protein [Pseudomonas gingeri]
MSRSFDPHPGRQRGDVLLESLIGILLMAIVGLGITYAASRAAVSQRDMKLQNIVVNQMRSLLEQNGALLCSTNAALLVVSLPTQTSPLPIVATCTSAPAVTVGTSTLSGGTPQSAVVLTTRTQDSSLFGGVIRVGDES